MFFQDKRFHPSLTFVSKSGKIAWIYLQWKNTLAYQAIRLETKGKRSDKIVSKSFQVSRVFFFRDTNLRGKLSTFDLLIKVTRFVKKENDIFNKNS